MSDGKQHVEEMLGQLAPHQLDAIVRLIEVMLDPVSLSIANAPLEEEEISPAIAVELDAAHASILRGEGIPHGEIMRQFGLKSRG